MLIHYELFSWILSLNPILVRIVIHYLLIFQSCLERQERLHNPVMLTAQITVIYCNFCPLFAALLFDNLWKKRNRFSVQKSIEENNDTPNARRNKLRNLKKEQAKVSIIETERKYTNFDI